MPIEVACGKCGAKLRAPDNAAGRTAKCPKCDSPIIVPSPVIEAELVEETTTESYATSPPTSTFDDDEFRSAYRPPASQPPGIQSQGTAALPGGQLGDEFAMRMLLPVGRSWLAIVAGYLGLFSLICFPAPFALVFGILAIMDIRKHPQKHGMGRATFGVVMGVLGTIGLLVGVAAMIANISSGRH